MKILVIGGTNFIGPVVVHQLVAMNHEVTVFHRGKTTAKLPPGVQEILGNRSQITNFKSQFQQLSPEIVLDMVAYTEQDAQTLMNAFEGIARRVVAISSIDVYAAYDVILGKEFNIVPTPLTEDSPLRSSLYPFREMPNRPLNAPADYEKILVERVVMGNSNLAGTILRLPMVYGVNDPRHRFFPYLKRMDDKRPVIIIPENIAKWRGSYGYVENVAHAIALAATDEKAKGQIYNVADAELLTEAERVAKLSKITGWQGKIIALPKQELPVDWNLPLNPEQDWFVDTTRIRQELGYKEIVSSEQALRQTIAWQINNPPQEAELLSAPWLFDYATEDEIFNRENNLAKQELC